MKLVIHTHYQPSYTEIIMEVPAIVAAAYYEAWYRYTQLECQSYVEYDSSDRDRFLDNYTNKGITFVSRTMYTVTGIMLSDKTWMLIRINQEDYTQFRRAEPTTCAPDFYNLPYAYDLDNR